MSSKPVEKTSAELFKAQAIRAGYKAGRTTYQRVMDKSDKPWHHELDDLLTETLARDRS